MDVLNYGGGRQTIAACILIAQGKLPKPDRIIIADTGREKTSTWDYLAEVTQPLLGTVGMQVEIAPRSLAYVDLYAHNGDLLVPVYTKTGKLTAFCSTEWKQRVVRRHLRAAGVSGPVVNWIGYAHDEQRRIKRTREDATGPWFRRFPLVELMLEKTDCQQIIRDAGLPMPPPSSCWMCPNMPNEEWRGVRDNYPDDWRRACELDAQLRAEDIEQGGSGVWLHHSRQPLAEANIDLEDRRDPSRQCALGMCYV
jgi:hypothetical protein